MPSWRSTLTTAGITDPRLRADYTDAARRVLRREPAPYLALRLLAAPALVPWLAAGLAFMNRVDDVAETGSADRRAAGLKELGTEVRRALETGDSPDPLLRAYAHAVDSRGLPTDWVFRFLDGAATEEAVFDGCAAEEEFQAYLDAYAWPGVLVFTGLQYQGGPDAEQAAGWRRFVDAAQRVDFLDLTAPGLRAVAATMTELMEHQLTAVERAGAGALRKDVGYGFTAPLRTLVRARARRPRTAT